MNLIAGLHQKIHITQNCTKTVSTNSDFSSIFSRIFSQFRNSWLDWIRNSFWCIKPLLKATLRIGTLGKKTKFFPKVRANFPNFSGLEIKLEVSRPEEITIIFFCTARYFERMIKIVIDEDCFHTISFEMAQRLSSEIILGNAKNKIYCYWMIQSNLNFNFEYFQLQIFIFSSTVGITLARYILSSKTHIWMTTVGQKDISIAYLLFICFSNRWCCTNWKADKHSRCW